MKTSIWACILSIVFLLIGCGGGGGRSGDCSGSTEYCAEYAPSSGVSGSGTGGSVTPAGGFAKSGTGDTVFTIPADVTRIRIQGNYEGYVSNFFVKVADTSLVIATIGTSKSPTFFDGTYLVTGGSTVEISNSNGVNWTITQVIADTIPANPSGLYVKTGTGDTVFTIPTAVTRIRIQGTFAGYVSNFFVKVAGSSLVIETIGTSKSPAFFDGTYLVTGGSTVEITNSSGVAWTFTEVP
jgi:hypothetical protein